MYEKINIRVDRMIEAGLIKEAEDLYKEYGPDAPVFKGVGYKQLVPYLQNNIELEQAIEDVKQATRNYAKRQLTWWRNRDIIQLDGKRLESSIK